jgi:tetratricopeptide (TPR) repeat protein
VYQPLLCDYFQVDSIAELGLGPTRQAAFFWTWATPAEKEREVQRRRLLQLGVEGTAACLLPVPVLTAAAQILSGRRRLSTVALDAAEDIATHLAATYTATPDRTAISAAAAHAYTLADLLTHASMTPALRTRLTVLAADATSLAGYGHLNAGRYAQADRWFAAALRLARQAGDRRLEALALASHAWSALDGPSPNPAAAIAALEAAADLESFLPPAECAYVLAHLARERAALGEDVGSGRLLEQARTAAARVRRDDAGWGCWSTVGELTGWDGARIDVFTGIRSLRLSRPAEALALLGAALDATTRPVRRVHLHHRITQTCVALDDPDRACASALAALDEADPHSLGVIPKRSARSATHSQLSGRPCPRSSNSTNGSTQPPARRPEHSTSRGTGADLERPP